METKNNKISRWISITERCSLQYRSKAFEDIKLCGNHHMYIFVLCRKPGISQEELVKSIHVNKSNVARSLKILEEDGFIYKEISSSDKRSNLIYPTPKAYDVLPFIREKISSWNEILSFSLTDVEKETLDNLLKKVAINACNYANKEFEEE